jgi:putative ABC transport system substrate-binding protein
MNRRDTVLVILALGTAPLVSVAQQPAKVWRVGYLDYGSRQSIVDSGKHAALMQGLLDFGYVEGRNMVIEERYADGKPDRAHALAAELVGQKVDLILTSGSPTSKAAQQATATIPIVIVTIADPVGEGVTVSLARPGGNITGMSTGGADTLQKLVELLGAASPGLKRIAVLTNPTTGTHVSNLSRVQAAANTTGKQVVPVSARTPAEIERVFATMARERADALVIPIDGFMYQQRAQIAALALKHRLPSIYPTAGYAEAGGLMSYGADINDNARRAGYFVDKILKGAKPSDIPFEQPTRYYLVVNRKTANAIGIKLSNELLLRATKVIE